MPITASAALEAIRATVAASAGVGWTVIFGQQPNVRLATPYITIQPMTDDVAYGHAHESVTGSTLTVVMPRRMSVQIQAFGAGGIDVLMALSVRLFTSMSTIATSIRAAGVTPQSTSGPRNITAAYVTANEPRAVLTLIADYTAAPSVSLGVAPAESIVVAVDQGGPGDVVSGGFTIPIEE